jgi:CPA2 family monovalent cation:H+ antiporter-2
MSIVRPPVKKSERDRLVETSGTVSYVPFVVMGIISLLLTIVFIVFILQGVYHSATAVIGAVLLAFITITVFMLLPSPRRKRISKLEKRCIDNINECESRRTGRDHNLVSDLQVAYMRVGQDCPFIGDRLRNLDLRTRYGVSLVNIQRGSKSYPVPSGDMRIFPGDILGVIGTEVQIQRMLPLVEAQKETGEAPPPDVKFMHFAIGEKSPIVGVRLEDTRLREDYGALLVAVQRGEDDYISPTPDLTFMTGDILWIVGNSKQLSPLKG